MEFHPIADIFPMMADDEFERFVEDIRVNGQLQPIYTFENKIIDGRNRFIACMRLGREPVIEEWRGSGSMISFIVSLNLSRRHLNESQRAIAAGRARDYQNIYLSDDKVPIGTLMTQPQAAQALNVSVRSVKRAAQVLQNAEPEVIEAVEQGKLSVNAAARISEVSRESQRRIVRRGVENLRKFALQLTKRTIKAAPKGVSAGCLVCNPALEFTEDAFKRHLVKLLSRAPAVFARYIDDGIAEMDEFALVEDIQISYEKIIAAIDAGYKTRPQIKEKTKLGDVLLDAAIAFLIEHNTIGVNRQYKHETARGASNLIYYLKKEVNSLKNIKPQAFDDYLSSKSIDYDGTGEI